MQMQTQTHYLHLHSCLHMSVGEGKSGERQEGVEVGGSGDEYCGYCGYCRYGYEFVMGHKIVTHIHTCAGKDVIPATGYLYLCSSLPLIDLMGTGNERHTNVCVTGTITLVLLPWLS